METLRRGPDTSVVAGLVKLGISAAVVLGGIAAGAVLVATVLLG